MVLFNTQERILSPSRSGSLARWSVLVLTQAPMMSRSCGFELDFQGHARFFPSSSSSFSFSIAQIPRVPRAPAIRQ